MFSITTVILAAGKAQDLKTSIRNYLSFMDFQLYLMSMQLQKKYQKKIVVCNKDNIKELKSIFKDCIFVTQNKQKGTADAIEQAKKR